MEGRVLKYHSGFYHVFHDGVQTVCKIRGRLKSGRKNTDIIAIGDLVEFEILPDGSGRYYLMPENGDSVMALAEHQTEKRVNIEVHPLEESFAADQTWQMIQLSDLAPEVIDLTGKTEEEATAWIKDNGFTLGDVTHNYSSSVDNGYVISQNPEAGTELLPGDEITLKVSIGPEPETKKKSSGSSGSSSKKKKSSGGTKKKKKKSGGGGVVVIQ